MLTVVAVVETFIAPISLERKVEPATSSVASRYGRAHSHCCECESPHRETFAATKSLQAEPRRKEGKEENGRESGDDSATLLAGAKNRRRGRRLPMHENIKMGICPHRYGTSAFPYPMVRFCSLYCAILNLPDTMPSPP